VAQEWMERTGRREVAISRERPPPSESRVIGTGQARAGRASMNGCRTMAEPGTSRARAVGRGMECRSAGMGSHMRTQACAATDPPAGHPRAAHMHGTAAHAHSAAANVNAAATEVRATAAKMSSAATPTAEVATPATATDMATAATTTETAASRVSRRRHKKGKAYCGRARRDFPHGMTSLSGPNAEANAGSPGPFRRRSS